MTCKCWAPVAITALLAISLSACATITTGTTQSVRVETQPEGAACDLRRSGVVIATVDPTPGAVEIGRSRTDVAVVCRKDGYGEESAPLASGLEAATLGNFLIGGLVGAAIDASSGANRRYPGRVSLILEPEIFPNAEERDDFYAQAADRARRDADAEIATVKEKCLAKGACGDRVEAVEAARDEKLAKIETKRLNAPVAETTAAERTAAETTAAETSPRPPTPLTSVVD